MRVWKLGIVLVCGACGTDSKSGDSDTGPVVPTETDADTDSDADTDTDTETDTDTDVTTPVTGCYDVPITVEGGYGAIAYAPLADGDIVAITHGPQGGWHIEGAVKVDHVHASVSIFTRITVVSTGQIISGLQGLDDANIAYVGVIPTGECSGEVWGIRAFLNDFTPSAEDDGGKASFENDICALDDQEVLIEWEVLDLLDDPAAPRIAGTDSVTVKIAMDPLEQAPYFCP